MIPVFVQVGVGLVVVDSVVDVVPAVISEYSVLITWSRVMAWCCQVMTLQSLKSEGQFSISLISQFPSIIDFPYNDI